MDRKYLPILIISILCLIWSSTWLVIKLGLGYMPPFLSAGLRFLIAFVALSIIGWKRKVKFPQTFKDHSFLILFGFTNFATSYGLVYWGEQYINSGLTSVLFSIMPFYTAILSIKMLPSENITFKKILGIAVGIGGLILIFSDQLMVNHPMAYWGMTCVLISPVFSAYGTILGKKARQTWDIITLNTLPLLYASLVFFVIHFFTETNLPVRFSGMAIFSLFYLGLIGTSLAFLLYFYVLKETSAVSMSLITFITPPLALIWGWAVLGEAITLKVVIGMVIIFSGIWIVRGRKIKNVKVVPGK